MLSPSTAAYDRGDKFLRYRGIASLGEYVLIDPDKQTVELYRRGNDGLWVLRDIAPDTPLELSSVGVSVAWDRLLPPDKLSSIAKRRTARLNALAQHPGKLPL